MQSPDILTLPGVGPAKQKAYRKLGVETVRDLAFFYPRAYENRGDVKLLSETPDGETASVILTVATEPRSVNIRRGMTLLKFRAFDDSGTAEITFFNQDFLKKSFFPGEEYRFYGKIVHPETPRGRYTMSSPAFEPYDETKPLPHFVPVYPLTEGLSGKILRRDMQNALKAVLPTLSDPLPADIRLRNRLCTLPYAVRNIQMPEDYSALAAAKRRLIFDEFFFFSIGTALSASPRKRGGAPVCAAEGSPDPLSRLTALLPYELTGAQKHAIGEIRADMKADCPMRRILVGDVGSGKTICAAAAILFALLSGRQAVLMAPTEILARQHFAELSHLFGELGFRTELLIGATSAREKRRIRASLALTDRATRTDLVVGTHALLSEGVEFAEPGLVVTDEQHRFGVEQRATLSHKCKDAHLLVMSATPIPRSLALVLYGDLDISRLDEMPKGRQKVETFAVDGRYRDRLNAFIRKQVSLGGQVYVVCPAIESGNSEEAETDAQDGDFDLSAVSETADASGSAPSRAMSPVFPLRSAVDCAEELSRALPDIPVGLLHGKMKSNEKDAVMADFAAGKTKVLVSTTVIEVGVNVPSATLMIVENAERFGLSQLHQLRGRVGRGRMQSYCVLVSEAMRPSAAGEASGGADSREKMRERLLTLCETSDGFAIAEKDLSLRGPGDFLRSREGETIRQSGGVRFKIADLCTDAALFRCATEEAKTLIGKDPTLSSFPELKSETEGRFCTEEGTVN